VNSDGPPTPDAFLWDQCGVGGVCSPGRTTLHTVKSWLAMANYTHYWTDTLRSNLAGSYWHQSNGFATSAPSGSSANAAALFKQTYTAHANLIWSPVPQTNFGVEFDRQWAKKSDGQTGAMTRVQVSAQFKF